LSLLLELSSRSSAARRSRILDARLTKVDISQNALLVIAPCVGTVARLRALLQARPRVIEKQDLIRGNDEMRRATGGKSHTLKPRRGWGYYSSPPNPRVDHGYLLLMVPQGCGYQVLRSL
ncbi:unnamed protein product, partial [Scytosiphon promiscuus]